MQQRNVHYCLHGICDSAGFSADGKAGTSEQACISNHESSGSGRAWQANS